MLSFLFSSFCVVHVVLCGVHTHVVLCGVHIHDV